MQSPKHIHIKDYAYDLPDERIAKYPLAQRDQSKLLLRRSDGSISEDTFCRLPEYLKAGALMVFNNTKVIQARLHFRKPTGGLIEVFCLEPHTPADYQQSFAQTGGVVWTCLVGNLKKWRGGTLERAVTVGEKCLTLTAERVGEAGAGHAIRLAWGDDTITFSEVLEAIGELPIPPYLGRQTEDSDLKTYQTVYSKIKGSVAAPTAGLHFTPEVLAALDARGIERNEVTLHVGAGTFKPVKSEEIEGHTMHSEWIAVERRTVECLIAHGGQCIAVGTTSVRTLESLYYIGILLRQKGIAATEADLHVPQWLPYEIDETESLSAIEALGLVLEYMDRNEINVLHTSTQIIIAPGYKYHIVKTIVTNFHQPQSTLLLLVSAFVGGDWQAIYDYALTHDFRFLSYGDSSVLNYDAMD